jgi:Secretion system C-terminal sorting domain
LSTVPQSDVEVVVTPDMQIDLGNGPGVPVTLLFPANAETANSQTLHVVANNDLVVEADVISTLTIDAVTTDADYLQLQNEELDILVHDNDVIGIEETEHSSFLVYPVPAKDELNIQPTGALGNYDITLYDLTGRKVLQTTTNGAILKRLDVSSLAMGSYIMNITSDILGTEVHQVKVCR